MWPIRTSSTVRGSVSLQRYHLSHLNPKVNPIGGKKLDTQHLQSFNH